MGFKVDNVLSRIRLLVLYTLTVAIYLLFLLYAFKTQETGDNQYSQFKSVQSCVPYLVKLI